MRLHSMEYTADIHREVIFSSVVLHQVEEQHELLPLALMWDLAEEECGNLVLESVFDQVLKTLNYPGLDVTSDLGGYEKPLLGTTLGRIFEVTLLGHAFRSNPIRRKCIFHKILQGVA